MGRIGRFMNKVKEVRIKEVGGNQLFTTFVSVGFAVPQQNIVWEGVFDGIRVYLYKM